MASRFVTAFESELAQAWCRQLLKNPTADGRYTGLPWGGHREFP